MKLFYSTLLIFFVSDSLAETSEQYKYRAEFFFGNITKFKLSRLNKTKYEVISVYSNKEIKKNGEIPVFAFNNN